MGRKGKKSSSAKGGNSEHWILKRELAPISATYSGPIVPKASARQESLYTIVLKQAGTVSSTAGGIISQVFGSYPLNTTSWSSFAACFDEYRVLGYRVRYFPRNRYDPGLTQSQSALYMVADHSGNSAITTLAQVAGYESTTIKGTGDPMSKSIWMDGADESVFTNTANANTPQIYIKMFADALAVSSVYGEYLQEFLVQFKGHGQ